VAVNDEMETEIPGIYAVGDVVGKYMLAHVATSEAMVAVHNALGKKYWMDYSTVPRATFTSPEVASVGTTEEELKKSGAEYRVGRFAYAASGKAVCMGEKEGFIKIISDDDTGRIVGATIAGHSAAEIIGEVAVAMRMEASPGDIVTTIHTHPTISEVILEASEDTMGLSIHKMVRRSRPEEE
jgi:dihydrolipoamide dehydrogenase